MLSIVFSVFIVASKPLSTPMRLLLVLLGLL